VPSSLHGIQVLDPHRGFALNSCDRIELPGTCRFDSRFACHVGGLALYEPVHFELLNLRKRSNLVTSDYD